MELEDPNILDECVESLVRLVGGTDINDIVKGMMNHLMNYAVMSNFSDWQRKYENSICRINNFMIMASGLRQT